MKYIYNLNVLRKINRHITYRQPINYNSKQHSRRMAHWHDSDCSKSSHVKYDMSTYLRSCTKEIIEPIDGRVSGKVPTWLNGSLLRNGPGSWKVGDMTFQHLFDCSALMHRFAITNGNVTYQNRLIQSKTFEKNQTAKRIVVSEFGTAAVPDPCHTIFDRFSSIFQPITVSDNTLISVYPFGDEFYTFTESPFINKINPRTLDTEKRISMTDYTGIVNHTAHPHVLANGTVFNLGLSRSKRGLVYNIIAFPHGESMFKNASVQAQIPCRWKLNPSYMHSFGITENYFIIVEQPLSVSLIKILKTHVANGKFSSCLKWFDDEPSIFYVIDRKTGQLAYKFYSEPFFFMHIINQYEENHHIVIDICCYKNAELLNSLYLETLLNIKFNSEFPTTCRVRPFRFVLPLTSTKSARNVKSFAIPQILKTSFSLSALRAILQRSKLMRHLSQYKDTATQNFRNQKSSKNLVTLPNTKAAAYQKTVMGQIFVRPEMLCDVGCEVPRINYDTCLGTKYKFCYAISTDMDDEKPGGLFKVNVVNKTHKKWYENNCYPSEPIFVPSPDAVEEDDGIILSSIVWGGSDVNKVGLLVICAKTWTEMGRCVFETNEQVPRCLHGWFAKDIL